MPQTPWFHEAALSSFPPLSTQTPHYPLCNVDFSPWWTLNCLTELSIFIPTDLGQIRLYPPFCHPWDLRAVFTPASRAQNPGLLSTHGSG